MHKKINDCIPFEDATYVAKQAFLVAADRTATILEQTVITVYTGAGGKKKLSGTGLVSNILMVELLEENDDLDLILDFRGEFKYWLSKPKLSAGKVFSPNVKSSLHFIPTTPWRQITKFEFDLLLSQLKIL